MNLEFRKRLVVVMFIMLSILSGDVFSSELEILAQRGQGKVTQDEFVARADKIPENMRRGTLRDQGRLRDVINALLLRSQLAEEARTAGFDKQETIIGRMKLAAEAELAEAWLQHYVKVQTQADFEMLARETYELDKEKMLSFPKIDVTHILVSDENRSTDEARVLANSIKEQLVGDPEKFDELVKIHSEDPSSGSNHGKFYSVKKGDMVKSFEDTAFALSEGEISKPVRTQYGFHIIRLDKLHPSETLAFDEVKRTLINRERTRHEDRLKEDYLIGLTSLEVKMTEEALKEMVRRVFGEDYIESTTDGVE